jgi:hypothetical protein
MGWSFGEAIRRTARIRVLPPPPFGLVEQGRFSGGVSGRERHLDGELV